MWKAVLAAGVLCVAAACGSNTPTKTVTVTATPSIAWDDNARVACQQAAAGAWSNAHIAAKTSTVRELQDVALREEQTGATNLVKAWCAEHYHG